MTVGIITNSYPPNLNGVSVCVKNLELALIASGVKVVIVTPKVPGAVYANNILPIPSYAVPAIMSKDLRLTTTYNNKNIQDFFTTNKVDIIHSHDTIMGGMDAITISQKLKVPVIHTYHTYLEEYGYFNVPGYKLFIRNYSKFICDYSDAVIVLSKKIEHYLLEINVKSELISLPNIYVPKKVDNDLMLKSKIFIEHNLLDSSFNIILFGRVAKEKNILMAIQKLEPLFDLHPRLRLIILGDGPLIPEVKEYIISNEIYNKVILFGAYNYTDLSYISKYCKFYFNTSTSEVLPTTALEATSLGLPLITINDSAYNYILTHGKNGLSLSEELITQVINQLIENPASIDNMAKEALIAYNNYMEVDFRKQYIDLYQRIIDNYKPTHLSKKLVKNFTFSLAEFFENFDITKFDYFKK
jgi:1,2-diacylglycerol 3-alpha-glucosyltransferase